MNTETQRRIDDCLNCQATCEATLGYWLARNPGARERTDPLVLLDCAESCRTMAGLLLRRSPHQEAMRPVCARICEACAAWCERFARDSVMAECATACRACRQACE